MQRAGETELAWAAGFFDGEGSTHLAKQSAGRGKSYVRISVTQKYPEVLHRFAAAVGVGKIYGPYLSQNAPFLYCATGDDAKAALTLLWPYLDGRKIAQAQAALDQETVETRVAVAT